MTTFRERVEALDRYDLSNECEGESGRCRTRMVRVDYGDYLDRDAVLALCEDGRTPDALAIFYATGSDEQIERIEPIYYHPSPTPDAPLDPSRPTEKPEP